MREPERNALRLALETEYAAIFAYGVIEAFAGPNEDMATEDLAAHRTRRDATIALLTRAGADGLEPQAGYSLPDPVTDVQSAGAAAVAAESDTATAWRGVAERADSPDTITFAVTALTESALRMAKWRRAVKLTPETYPFPGQT